MNTSDRDILSRVNRNSGMTVPEGYFADFAKSMMEKLPEHTSGNIFPPVQRTTWQRIRPYIYMAAMFCGVWLMMWLFNDISQRSQLPDIQSNPAIAKVLGTDDIYRYYDDIIDEYELMEEMYDDGITPAIFETVANTAPSYDEINYYDSI